MFFMGKRGIYIAGSPIALGLALMLFSLIASSLPIIHPTIPADEVRRADFVSPEDVSPNQQITHSELIVPHPFFDMGWEADAAFTATRGIGRKLHVDPADRIHRGTTEIELERWGKIKLHGVRVIPRGKSAKANSGPLEPIS